MSMMPAPSPNGNATMLADLKARTQNLPPDTPLGFFSAGGLDLMQRAANMLAHSTLVPPEYRKVVEKKRKKSQGGYETTREDNPNAISNCVLALNMAQRMGADPLMVMQNLYLVDGKPGWSSQFIIAAINACGKFSPLRFKITDNGEKEVEWTTKEWVNGHQVEEGHTAKVHMKTCVAMATEKSTGEVLEGPEISMDMAIKEGWFGKNGSKWQTMPDVMLRYRAASFFGKLYAPELLMGIQTAEEMEDKTITVEAVSPEEESGPDKNSMSMEDVKEKVEKPKRGRKKAELPTAETTTVDVTPEPAKQEVKPEPPQGEEPPLVEFLQHPENHPGVGPEKEPIQPADDYDEDEDRFYSTSANENKTAEGDIECPDPLPDGSPRYVSEAQCKTCPKFKGCPNWS